MKKKIFLLAILLLLPFLSFANDEALKNEQTVQTRINHCAMKILNANEINKPVVFVYDNREKEVKLKIDKTLTKRQVIVYRDDYKFFEDENELAAYLARQIVFAARSYDGIFNGALRSLQMKAAPKKFEIVADKIAVDYMVKAGYNPIALITYIQKTQPQRRYDIISNKNLTSKRLMMIYEYIYTKYPYFLVNNEYKTNENYQNFLLNSENNRYLLLEKIKTNSKEKIKYE